MSKLTSAAHQQSFLCVLHILYRERRNSLETNFHGQATPTKIKHTKMCTHEELATVITVGYSNSRNLALEILWPWKFLHLRYINSQWLPTINVEIFVVTIFCGLNFCEAKFLRVRVARCNLLSLILHVYKLFLGLIFVGVVCPRKLVSNENFYFYSKLLK